jgi:hypothetical protein
MHSPETAEGTRSPHLGDASPPYHMSADGKSSHPLAEVPPDYHMAMAARSVQHTYTLEHNTKTWFTFELTSRAPSADRLPYFFGFAPITGRVILDLAKPEYITAITIEARTSYFYAYAPTYVPRLRSRADGLDASRSGLE